MAKILAIDLDGTLFYPKGHKTMVSKKNVKFLRRFIDEGNKVVLVSSRAKPFVDKVIEEIDRPIDSLPCTGAIIKIGGEVVSESTLNNEIATRVIHEIIDKYKPLSLLITSEKYELLIYFRGKVTWFTRLIYGTWYKMAFGIYRQPFELSNELFEEELNSGKIYGVKVVFGIRSKWDSRNKELNKKLREDYSNDIEASWVGTAIELTPIGCDKANAIKHYMSLVNADKDDIYVIGDSGNDISMFNEFHEHSFVMSHAYPSVKKYAKHEVPRVYELEKYVLGKEKK
jgi:hypothetical protein